MVGLLIGPFVSADGQPARPYRWILPLGTVIVTGLGMMGLTVAKRQDLVDAMRDSRVLAAPDDREPGADVNDGPIDLCRHERADRRQHHGRRGLRLPAGTLVVPRFVVDELQSIADNRDQARRVRGRRGLEVLAVLQKDPRVGVELTDEDAENVATVDAKLIELAGRAVAASSPMTSTSTVSRSSTTYAS